MSCLSSGSTEEKKNRLQTGPRTELPEAAEIGMSFGQESAPSSDHETGRLCSMPQDTQPGGRVGVTRTGLQKKAAKLKNMVK